MFGFDMTAHRFNSFQSDFNTIVSDLVGTAFDITDFHVYPSIDNPMVVSLEPDLNIDNACSDAIEALEQHDGNVRWGPHPPHITLFKGGNAGLEDDWGELTESTHDQLRQELNDCTPAFELTIDSIPLET